MRILLVEDDVLQGDSIRIALRQEGYTVEWLKDGFHAQNALETDEFDLMLLDLGLPGQSGLSVLEWVRRQGDKTPVLVLTARDSIDDRVGGLDAGADDYMVKPFDLDELSARIRALIRRSQGRAHPLLQVGSVILDPASRQITCEGQPLELSPRAYMLLHLLMERAGQVLTRSRLEEKLYGWDGGVVSNTLEVYIHQLRKVLGKEFIRTVRGVGYLIDKV
ncbi:MAG: response regulator [Magnetococcales bacterium]|nr:response regulator [Magnetococcales bacterium]